MNELRFTKSPYGVATIIEGTNSHTIMHTYSTLNAVGALQQYIEIIQPHHAMPIVLKD